MFKLSLLAGALALALSFPVFACDTVEEVRAMALANGGADGIFEVIEADLLAEFAEALNTTVPDGAQRAIFVAGAGGAAYGFEMADGCLTPPTFIKPGVGA